MKIQKKIDVRLTRKFKVDSLRVVQYDTGVQLVFNVLDFVLPSGTTATLYVRKKSGKFVYQEKGITVSGNTVTVDLENQALTEHGETFYQLEFKNGSDTISTFSSSMWVERSLSDADAVESTTVIAAFEAKTAEQIAEIVAATDENIARAKSAIEAKGAETLASIPETYTKLQSDVDYLFNNVANAIKGSVSGSVVAVSDVSPVDHNPAVWVHGKNLIVYPYGEASLTRDGVTWTIDEADKCVVVNGTPTQNTSFHVAFQYHKTVRLKKGKVYTLSCVSSFTDATGYVYLQNVLNGVVIDNATVRNDSVTFTAKADGNANIGIVLLKGVTYNNEKIVIQLEEGATATAYEPYLDPSTVTVKRCGKNLVAYPYNEMSMTRGGITFTVANDGKITVKGTSTGAYLALVRTADKALYLHKDQTYFFSCVPSNGGYATYYAYVAEEDGETFFDLGSGVKIKPTKNGYASITVVVKDGVTVSNALFKPMLEVGEKATAFEPYNGAEHIPETDGTIPGMTSISPNMTVMTDTAGAIVDCVYNVDLVKFIGNLATGGATLKSTNVTMYANKWVLTDSGYSQIVSMNGVTVNSKIDLQPTPDQLAELVESEISLTTGNDNGTVTVYAIGGKPDADCTMQALITEVVAV